MYLNKNILICYLSIKVDEIDMNIKNTKNKLINLNT